MRGMYLKERTENMSKRRCGRSRNKSAPPQASDQLLTVVKVNPPRLYCEHHGSQRPTLVIHVPNGTKHLRDITKEKRDRLLYNGFAVGYYLREPGHQVRIPLTYSWVAGGFFDRLDPDDRREFNRYSGCPHGCGRLEITEQALQWGDKVLFQPHWSAQSISDTWASLAKMNKGVLPVWGVGVGAVYVGLIVNQRPSIISPNQWTPNRQGLPKPNEQDPFGMLLFDLAPNARTTTANLTAFFGGVEEQIAEAVAGLAEFDDIGFGLIPLLP